MEFAAPRHTSETFPPYRFRPGANPHPTTAPNGHSHRPDGLPPPTVVCVSPEHWAESHDYLYGCDLYNHGYWWEAHEAWEGLWQVAEQVGPQGQFLQGLIQATACALKTDLGNRTGARRLLARSQSRLDDVLAQLTGRHFMGLELGRWLDAVRGYYGRVLAGDPVGHEPKSFPYLRLSPAKETS